jgi:putative ABC transport system permease protein
LSSRAPLSSRASLSSRALLSSRAKRGIAVVPKEGDGTRRRGPGANPFATFSRPSMTGLRSDLRYALRSLSRSWRLALGVLLTLGLGIGLGAPVLSLADHYFLRPPPGVSDPDRVLRLVLRGAGPNGPYLAEGLTGLDYTVMRSRARTLATVAGWINLERSLGRGANARSIPITAASASFFAALGVAPLMGRFYHDSEDVEGVAEAPCVVSYRFWQTSLDGAKDVIGRTLLIGEIRYTIVGVAPEHFSGLGFRAVDAWLPLRVSMPEFQGRDPQLWTTDRSAWIRIVARLKPGVSVAQATTEADLLYRTSGPRTRDKNLEGTFLWDPLQPGRSSMGSTSARISLWLGAGGALLLLLIAANLVNLFVARSAAHARQTAVRLAIGGGWRHLLRLQLVEALLLGIAAATLGSLLAVPATGVARSLLLPGTTWDRPVFDARVAALAFGIAFGVGAVVALWSTTQAMRANPVDLLRGAGSPHASGDRRTGMVRRTLLVVQAAVFAMLLTGASAFVLSLQRASDVDFGFDVGDLYAARLSLPADAPPERARELPISVPGSTIKPPWTLFDMATPDYPRTFGVQMRRGRWIELGDGPNAPPVMVINEALEKVFWPAGSAVGQCIRVGADSMPCRTIVGVVRNFNVTGTADDPARPAYMLPFAQTQGFRQRPALFFRPRADPNVVARSVRETLQTLEANLPAASVHPVRENIEWMVSPLRLGAAAFTTFGGVAAIVGAVGLYSVLAFLIIEQRRAYAIRLAIGAAPTRLARSIIRFSVVTVVVGMMAGYAAFIPLANVLESLLFHTRALEPVAVAGVVMLGVLIAVAAAIIPVRTVIRTDVMAVLREQ